VGSVSFHDEEIVDYRNEALASESFASWATANPDAVPLGASDCAGYRVPLFLGVATPSDSCHVGRFASRTSAELG
jgi:hypothetical protein